MRNIVLGFLMVVIMLAGCKNGTFGPEKSTKESAELIKTFALGQYSVELKYNETVDTTFLDMVLSGSVALSKKYKGKVTKHFVEDLDQDQKKELYLVASNLTEKNLYAFQLYGEKFETIPIGAKRMNSSIEPSTYKVERNQIVEYYSSKDVDGAMKTMQSRYNLVKKENGYTLLPQGWQSRELEGFLGQFDLENSDKKTKKTLLIGARDGGKYNVRIDVKNTSNGKQLCQFKGLGEFVEDLYVSLNSVNPDLKGELKSFLGPTAIVYTADKADYKELSNFCSENGSIAGSFKKLITENE